MRTKMATNGTVLMDATHVRKYSDNNTKNNNNNN